MPMKLLSTDDFRAAAKAGERPNGTVFRFATADPQTVGDAAARTKRFVFSDATIDHSDDSIDPKGWNLSVFNRNPVALFSHMSWDPPIGRAHNVGVQGKQLVGDIEFATAEVYDFADTIFRLVDGGFLKAVSVGFKPDEWSFSTDKDRPYGIDFKKQTLLEISVCPVPCNPAALTEARSMGVDTRPLVDWAEKVLDSGDTAFLPRKDLESLRRQASGVDPVRFYVKTSRVLTGEAAERVRDDVKRWQNGSSDDVLMLPPGVELKALSEHRSDEVEAAEDAPELEGDEAIEAAVAEALKTPTIDTLRRLAAIAAKAGRRISAKTKAALAEAMGHHEAGMKCMKDIMDGDGPDDEPDDDPDDMTDKAADPAPPVIADTDDDLTPEQRRMKEVRALRASIPTKD